MSTAPASAAVPPKIGAALVGVLISAMMSGLNSRIAGLALADLRGALGHGIDEASWINACATAGELLVMPFATWFAITFTVRRFYLVMLWATALIGAVLPFVVDLPLMIVLRTLQGITSGALIPLLMMLALRFLPPAIRLHGLALYALTATFAPNVAIWIAGYWLDTTGYLDAIWWQFLPAAVICTILVGWGLPSEPVIWKRFPTMNLAGLVVGVPALFLIGVAIGQGNRLDWFNSPLISFCLIAGGMGLVAYILLEWDHPSPFVRFQLLGIRNLQVAFTAFVLILMITYSGASLPMGFLSTVHGYRSLQSAPLGLMVGLPQIVAGSLVALLLYRKWVDARFVFAGGLLVIAFACFWGARIDATWTWHEFVPIQMLHAIGQPMTVVSMLFLSTSSVQPSEGPFVAGLVNTLRVFGTLIGVAVIGRVELVRDHFHSAVLTDRWGMLMGELPMRDTTAAQTIAAQVTALGTADIYFALGCVALLLACAGALFNHIPAPVIPVPPATPTEAAR